MTDDNQNVSDPNNDKPRFGADVENITPTDTVTFTKEEIDALKKQNTNAQDFIKELKGETKELREQVKSMRDELEKAATINDLVNTYSTPSDNEPGPKTPPLDEEALLTKLKEEVFRDMTAAQQVQTENENWQAVTAELKTRHGDEWAKYVDARAEELGMTNPQMESFAKTSPRAFMELVQGQTRNNPAPSQSSSRTPDRDSRDVTLELRRVAVLRKDMNSEEGISAMNLWNDPEWQRQQRLQILKDVEANGFTNWRS